MGRHHSRAKYLLSGSGKAERRKEGFHAYDIIPESVKMDRHMEHGD